MSTPNRNITKRKTHKTDVILLLHAKCKLNGDVSLRHPFLLLFILCVLCAFVFDPTQNNFLSSNLLIFSIALIALAVLAALFFRAWLYPSQNRKRSLSDHMILALMIAGFLLRLFYILYTSVDTRQHDVFFFGQNGPITQFRYQRHAEYIEYICRYFRLPSTDPSQIGLSQLYHPPLHHIIAAIWLRIGMIFTPHYTRACESIQFLTLFYSSCCMLICHRLFKTLGLNKLSLVIPMAIICFHPTLIIMAGSVNNDILSITFALAAILAAVKWYKEPTLPKILLTALLIGCSMMTKLSGALIAPGIAILFLSRFFQDVKADRSNLFKYLKQFVLFAFLCVPLGLWWQVKNAVQFGLPITFVPSLGSNSGQYLGNYSVFQRLLELPKESLQRIFMAWPDSYGSSYSEYNCLLALLKTSVFGEFTLFYDQGASDAILSLGTTFSKMLFYANALLVLISIIGMAVCLIKKWYIINGTVTAMLITVWGVVLLSYIKFCFEFPQTCTQNFRYAVPTMLVGVIFLGQTLRKMVELKKRSAKTVSIILCTTTFVFCFSSAAVYILLGIL